MKPIIFAVTAIALYGVSTVVIEQKLAKLNSLTILVGEFAITLAFAILVRQILIIKDPANAINLAFPTEKATWIALLILGVIVFVANFLFCESLILGGNAVVITSLMILMPVVTIAVRTIWIRETPNMYCIAGYVLAALSVLLVAKGSIK